MFLASVEQADNVLKLKRSTVTVMIMDVGRNCAGLNCGGGLEAATFIHFPSPPCFPCFVFFYFQHLSIEGTLTDVKPNYIQMVLCIYVVVTLVNKQLGTWERCW